MKDVIRWQLDRFVDDPLSLGHKTSQITSSDVATDEQASANGFATDLHRSITHFDICNLRDRDLSTSRIFDFQLGEFFDVGSPFRDQPDLHWKSSLPFEDLSNDFASHTGNGVQNVSSVNAIAGQRIAANSDPAVGKSCNLLSGDIRRTLNAHQGLDDLIPFGLEDCKIVTVEAQADIGANPCDEFLNPQFDRLGKAKEISWDVAPQRLLHLLDEILFADLLWPLIFGLHSNDHIGLVDPHRIVCYFRSTCFRYHRDDLREFEQASFHGFGHIDRGLQGDTRQSRRLDGDISFVEFRYKLDTKSARDSNTDRKDPESCRKHSQWMFHREPQTRRIGILEPPNNGGIFLLDPSSQKQRRQNGHDGHRQDQRRA